MILDPLFYTMAIPSVILIGLSKGGLTGIGALAVPLMAIVASPLQAAAVLMPILLILDIVAVWTYPTELHAEQKPVRSMHQNPETIDGR